MALLCSRGLRTPLPVWITSPCPHSCPTSCEKQVRHFNSWDTEGLTPRPPECARKLVPGRREVRGPQRRRALGMVAELCSWWNLEASQMRASWPHLLLVLLGGWAGGRAFPRNHGESPSVPGGLWLLPLHSGSGRSEVKGH